MEVFSHNCTRRKYYLSWLAWCLCLRGTRFFCRHGGREKNEAAGLLREGNKLAAMKYIQHKPWDSFCCFARLPESQKVKWEHKVVPPCPWSWHLCPDTALSQPGNPAMFRGTVKQRRVRCTEASAHVLKGLGLLDCFPKASQVVAVCL